MSSLMRFELGANSIAFEAGGDYPAQRVRRVYQVTDRSAGGKLHVETLGIQTIERTISFSLMPKVDYDALVDWFLNVSNGGEYDFTFTDEYGDSGTVKIVDSALDFTEVFYGRYSGSITLEYIS